MNVSMVKEIPSHTSSLVCEICFTTFTLKRNLNRHMIMHKSQKQEKCSRCNKSFWRKQNLVAHMKSHEKPSIFHTCTRCDKKFGTKKELHKHFSTHKEDKKPQFHACARCDEKFGTKKQLHYHMRTHKEEKKHYECTLCQLSCTRKDEFTKHLKTHAVIQSFSCSQCGETFSTRNDLRIHSISHLKCKHCNKIFKKEENLNQHIRVKHNTIKLVPIPLTRVNPSEEAFSPRFKLESLRTALRIFANYRLLPDEESRYDLSILFRNMRNDVIHYLEKEIEQKSAIKWYLIVKVCMSKSETDGSETIIFPFFASKTVIDTRMGVNLGNIDSAYSKINKSFEEFLEGGSGWTLKHIVYVEINSARYAPLQ